MADSESKMKEGSLMVVKDLSPSPMIRAALSGESTTVMVSKIANQLSKDLEESSRDTFTIADIREAQRKLFEDNQ